MKVGSVRILVVGIGLLGCRSELGGDPVGGDGSASDGPVFVPSDAAVGPACGYKSQGHLLHVAPDVDLCMPKVACNAETCPPTLGKCVSGECVFAVGYAGVATLPEAWATYYCGLANGGCHGVTQIEYPEITAAKVGASLGLPVCDGDKGTSKCVGIAASSPMVVGNSQLAKDEGTGNAVTEWGLGLTEASGLCYELTGPGGTVVVALTDRCGGYCKCGTSGFQECGPCVNAKDMVPNCSCVGTVPGLYSACCGRGCSTTKQECDWCASNNHPHFDLDDAAFGRLCGPEGVNGSCRIQKVRPLSCASGAGWPPGGGGAGCKAGSFSCAGPAPHQAQVPNTSCCCNWDLTPQPDGTCK